MRDNTAGSPWSCSCGNTQGNNASPQPGVGYHAGIGYDAVSGWGVPNGQALLDSLA